MKRSRLFAWTQFVTATAFALSLLSLSGSQTLAQPSPTQESSPSAAPAKKKLFEVRSPLSNYQVTLKKDGKIAGELTFQQDSYATFYARGSQMTRTDDNKNIVLSDDVFMRIRRRGMTAIELTADEIIIKVLAPAE